MRLIIFLCCISLTAYGQAPLSFSEVVKMEDSTVTAEKLYDRAMIWFSETFKNAEAVIQVSDRQAGQIVGKANFTFKVSSGGLKLYDNGYVDYTIKISFKNGRYKYEISSFYHNKGFQPRELGTVTDAATFPESADWNFKGMAGAKQKTWDELKQKCELEAKALATSLINHMSKIKESSDW